MLWFQNKDGDSAEVKIAKIAITNVLLWVVTWSPYAIIVVFGLIGQYGLITPLSSVPKFHHSWPKQPPV